MNTWRDRVADEGVAHGTLALALFGAGTRAGYEPGAIYEALEWTSIQLDPEADDYETWEATLLARLENPTSGER